MPTLDNNPVFPPGYPPQSGGILLNQPLYPTPDDGAGSVPTQTTAFLYQTSQLGHTTYRVASRYHFLSGLDVVPVAGNVGVSHQGVRFAAPREFRIATWEVESENGNQPLIPTPDSTYNEILVSGDFNYQAPKLDEAGEVRSWKANGYYIYKLITPRRFLDGFFAGAPVTDTIPFGATAYGDGNLVGGVLGPSPPPAGAANNFPQTGAEGLIP